MYCIFGVFKGCFSRDLDSVVASDGGFLMRTPRPRARSWRVPSVPKWLSWWQSSPMREAGELGRWVGGSKVNGF